jgi:hypothetical protein
MPVIVYKPRCESEAAAVETVAGPRDRATIAHCDGICNYITRLQVQMQRQPCCGCGCGLWHCGHVVTHTYTLALALVLIVSNSTILLQRQGLA